jgi:hypothetical protein
MEERPDDVDSTRPAGTARRMASAIPWRAQRWGYRNAVSGRELDAIRQRRLPRVLRTCKLQFTRLAGTIVMRATVRHALCAFNPRSVDRWTTAAEVPLHRLLGGGAARRRLGDDSSHTLRQATG